MQTLTCSRRGLICTMAVMGGLYALTATMLVGGGSVASYEVLVPLVCGIALGACAGSACFRLNESWRQMRTLRSDLLANVPRPYQVFAYPEDSKVNAQPPAPPAEGPLSDAILLRPLQDYSPAVRRQSGSTRRLAWSDASHVELVVRNQLGAEGDAHSVQRQQASQNQLKDLLHEQLKHSDLD